VKPLTFLLALVSLGLCGCKADASSDSGAVDTARAEQATPQSTITALFKMTPSETYEKINPAVIALGKPLNPDEQKLAQLGWDGERAASVYQYLIDLTADFESFGDTSQNGDSATVKVSVDAFPAPRAQESQSLIYIFELKKRGENWYIYELRTDHTPEGVYAAYRKRWEQTR
jgi:hypothetical protein